MASQLPFHARPLDEVADSLRTSPDRGLASSEAAGRLAREGPNRLTGHRGPSAWRMLAAQFLAPLVVILLVAGALSAWLGEHVEAAVIFGVVLANAAIGFVQERRAESAILALDALVPLEATVVRDGERRRVPSEELVVGDLVCVQSGDAVPADLRLVSVRDLQVEEAALTGESVPVRKRVEPVPADAPLGDRFDLAFAGTAVTSGRGTGLVVATADDTETGRIARLLSTTTTLETPLTRRIAALSRTLLWAILAITAAIVALELWRGRPLVDTLHAAVALAVGAIPEGLPAAVTILLAAGVSRMARRRAIVRRLPAVETLGSTTVICSDKTGTLTENRMTARRLVAVDLHLHVERESAESLRGGVLEEAVRIGALCNDARLASAPNGTRRIEGDPTEAALLLLAEQALVDVAAWRRLDVVPFESEHRYMATLDTGPHGPMLHVKGSSEVVLERCVDALHSDGSRRPLDGAALHAAAEELARDGQRVLCLARRALPGWLEAQHADVCDLTFVALVGLLDPPRERAQRAIETCRRAGVRVKMITGDHAATACAVADALGLQGARGADGRLRAVTGRELDTTPAGLLPALVEDVAVFARVSPEQKLRLVQALQSRGHVVAMTGDGVNDAPALKQADIGVAMGKGGTDVARSAAAMVLTDDDFATLEAAVEEGRGVYDNLRKFIAWTLPTNGGEALVLFVAVLLGTELPILPVQLLWINLVTAVLLGTALVFEANEPGLMDRPPRDVQAPILDRALRWRTVVMSCVVAGAAFGLFAFALSQDLSLPQARTVTVNAIIAVEIGYLVSCRSLVVPVWGLPTSNRWLWLGVAGMVALQLGFTYLPASHVFFAAAPLPAVWWAWFVAVACATLALGELKKLVGPLSGRAGPGLPLPRRLVHG